MSNAAQVLPTGPLPLRYRIPASLARGQYAAKKSVFVGTVAHAATLEEAHAMLNRVRAEHPDANHHAWAFLGHRHSPLPHAFSDGGEPGGTAGRPILGVLEGSGLQEVVAIGTRYFGGVLLGTGGLVRAYSQCIREALRTLCSRELVLHRLAEVTIAYDQYGAVKRLLENRGVRVDGERFAEHITLAIAVPAETVSQVSFALAEITAGRIRLEACLTSERYDEQLQARS